MSELTFNNTEETILTNLTKIRYKARANTLLVIKSIEHLRTKMGFKHVTSKDIENVINILDAANASKGLYRKCWKLDPEAQDGFGLRRSIGDILGRKPAAGGLGLSKNPRQSGGNCYIIPKDGITQQYLDERNLEV